MPANHACEYFGQLLRRLRLRFQDPRLETMYLHSLCYQSSLFIKFCFLVNLIAVLIVTLQEIFSNTGSHYVYAGPVHGTIVVVLFFISYRAPKANRFLGYAFIISYYISSFGLGMSTFVETVEFYMTAVCIGFLLAVFIDGSWMLSVLVNISMGTSYWYFYSEVAGDAANNMYAMNA